MNREVLIKALRKRHGSGAPGNRFVRLLIMRVVNVMPLMIGGGQASVAPKGKPMITPEQVGEQYLAVPIAGCSAAVNDQMSECGPVPWPGPRC